MFVAQPACPTCTGTSGPHGLLRLRDLPVHLMPCVRAGVCTSYLAFVTSQMWGNGRMTSTLDLGKTLSSSQSFAPVQSEKLMSSVQEALAYLVTSQSTILTT